MNSITQTFLKENKFLSNSDGVVCVQWDPFDFEKLGVLLSDERVVIQGKNLLIHTSQRGTLLVDEYEYVIRQGNEYHISKEKYEQRRKN